MAPKEYTIYCTDGIRKVPATPTIPHNMTRKECLDRGCQSLALWLEYHPGMEELVLNGHVSPRQALDYLNVERGRSKLPPLSYEEATAVKTRQTMHLLSPAPIPSTSADVRSQVEENIAATILKRPRSEDSFSSNPGSSPTPMAIDDSDDNSALEYVTPPPGIPPIAQALPSPAPDPSSWVNVLLSRPDWRTELVQGLQDLFLSDRSLAESIGKAVSATRTPSVPQPTPPPPPKKKVKISSSPFPSSLRAPSEIPSGAAPPPPKPSAPAPAVAAPVIRLPKRPPPASAPVVSAAAPVTRRSKRGKHTSHGPTCRGIILSPPADSLVSASSFAPAVIDSLNKLLAEDLKSDLCLTCAHTAPRGVLLESVRVPSKQETAFVLKHVRRIFPSPTGGQPITEAPATSTSYLKVVDVPYADGPAKDRVKRTRDAFMAACINSPVGQVLTRHIKHAIRVMRTSPHSDSAIVWVDIHDSTSGSSAKKIIGSFISVSGVNCRIAGARPHAGALQCSRCLRWGHHHSRCRALGARCALCGGPHSEVNHPRCVAPAQVERRLCVNCVAGGREGRQHAATDRSACPFWQHRYDRAWLKRQFKRDQ